MAPLQSKPPQDADVVVSCLFCATTGIRRGAFWHGLVEDTGAHYVAVCEGCIKGGKLGLLIGDALAGPEAGYTRMQRALERTGSEAYRAALVTLERGVK